MADEYRRDAPLMNEPTRSGWLTRADDLDEKADWYEKQADSLERCLHPNIKNKEAA
ncbi:hypothetical protein [Pararhizobium antarcticum]|uniref:hypothetical protein n=1 Tax=Pararhizobium antarcticum TaxID=1798805 RepID=UPI001587DD35|nr:hypothetical protein [Pararhizobium antarcticum]